jgi:hypothetical protein
MKLLALYAVQVFLSLRSSNVFCSNLTKSVLQKFCYPWHRNNRGKFCCSYCSFTRRLLFRTQSHALDDKTISGSFRVGYTTPVDHWPKFTDLSNQLTGEERLQLAVFLTRPASIIWGTVVAMSSYWLTIELFTKLSSTLFMGLVMNWKNCLWTTRRNLPTECLTVPFIALLSFVFTKLDCEFVSRSLSQSAPKISEPLKRKNPLRFPPKRAATHIASWRGMPSGQ